MNKGWLWEWRKCKSVCLCCVWKGLGLRKGHVFMVGMLLNAQHMWGGKQTWKQRARCPQLQRGLTGGRNAWVFKGVPMWYLWFSEGSSG